VENGTTASSTGYFDMSCSRLPELGRGEWLAAQVLPWTKYGDVNGMTLPEVATTTRRRCSPELSPPDDGPFFPPPLLR
jgi:hypothetical protein